MDPVHRFLALVLFFSSILTPPSAISAPAADIDTKTAIGEALQQRRQPQHIAGRIVDFTRSAEYAAAEDLLADLLVAKPIDIDGSRLLEKVYLLLSFTSDKNLLDQWCEARPFSHFPFTIRGLHYYERARVLDGANRTRLLDEKQRRNFNLFLRRAQADLLKAHELDPDDPGPPAALTMLSIQLKQPRSEMERWFSRAVAADPSWLGSYHAKLIYLSPWRYGSDQLMSQFALHCFEGNLQARNTALVTLDWLKLKSDRLGESVDAIRFLTSAEIYPLLSTGLDRHIDAFPLSPRIDEYRALKELVSGQPYVAVAAFGDALRQAPADTRMLKGRIEAYLAGRQFANAEADIDTLEHLEGPTSFSRSAAAAVLYRSHRDLDGAVRLYEQAIAGEPSPYRRKHYLLERAEMNRKHGRYALAIDDFSAAIREDALFEEAYLGRAKSQYARGNLDGALADLILLKSDIGGRLATHARSLINTYMDAERDKLAGGSLEKPSAGMQDAAPPAVGDPDRAAATADEAATSRYREHLISGLQWFYRKDYSAARRDFYRAIGANPGAAQAYFLLGTIAEQVDFDTAKARVFHEQAFRLDPANRDYLLGVSRIRHQAGECSSVIRDLSDSMEETSPQDNRQINAQIYFLRGLCRAEQGLIPEALVDMNEALLLDPQLDVVGGFIDHHQSGPKTVHIAVQPLQQVVNEQNQTDEPAIQRLLEEGRRLLQAGDAQQARSSFLEVIRLNPHSSEAYHQLGRISFEFDHDYRQASRYCSRAIAEAPDNPRYYFDRAAIHYHFRRYDRAVRDFTSALNLQPNNEQSRYYRGLSNHMLGNIDAARRDFNALSHGSGHRIVERDRVRTSWDSEIDQLLEAAAP